MSSSGGDSVGAKLVARAQNVNERVVPGTVFLSYHGEGRPWGRTYSDSNYKVRRDEVLDEFQRVCVDLIFQIERTRGPIVPRVSSGSATRSSTDLTYDGLEHLIETPTLVLERPTADSDWGGRFPRERALDLESTLCHEYFGVRQRLKPPFKRKDDPNSWTLASLRKKSHTVRRARKFRDGYYDKFVDPGVAPEVVDGEYRRWFEVQAREVESRGKGKETEGDKDTLFSSRFYSTDDVVQEEEEEDSQYGTVWTESEKEHFFNLLGRVGRHRLAEIAETMGSKSLVEVEEYHDLLFAASQHQKEVYTARIEAGEEFIPEKEIPVSYKDIPAAAEMSDMWISLEESFARGLEKREDVLSEGEPPFTSLRVDQEKEEEEESKNDILNLEGLLDLASQVFYPNPANGMDIQSKEYNTDLPVFEGIDGEVVKELLISTVNKTRELLHSYINIENTKDRPGLYEHKFQFLEGTRYSNLGRFFRQYFERSGSERLYEESGASFPESIVTPEVLQDGKNGPVIKECSEIVEDSGPKLYTNTGMLSASLKNVSKLDIPKFLDDKEQERVHNLLEEEKRYNEAIEKGEVDWNPKPEEKPANWFTEDLYYKVLYGSLTEKESYWRHFSPDILYPLRPEKVPELIEMMHEEETGTLERLDKRNSRIMESGLVRMFKAAAPYQYPRICSEINRVFYDQDKKMEDKFEKEGLRYKYDAIGQEINLWKQEVPEMSTETTTKGDIDLEQQKKAVQLFLSDHRGPGGGLLQPENLYPPILPYPGYDRSISIEDLPIHTDGTKYTKMIQREFRFRRVQQFFSLDSSPQMQIGDGLLHEWLDNKLRLIGKRKLHRHIQKFLKTFMETPTTNQYSPYYNEADAKCASDSSSDEEFWPRRYLGHIKELEHEKKFGPAPEPEREPSVEVVESSGGENSDENSPKKPRYKYRPYGDTVDERQYPPKFQIYQPYPLVLEGKRKWKEEDADQQNGGQKRQREDESYDGLPEPKRILREKQAARRRLKKKISICRVS
ncbi:hypothetical protein CJU90_5069 [Yarrowia sp. C11]|nr:hypothetical protein CJU90_5069 [Yarrowia sp. C11]